MADFTDWLDEQRRGELALELTEALAAVTQAVTAHDKPGTLTLTIKIAPAAHGELGTVIVSDDVKTKLPVAGRSASIWFVDEDYGLSRSNPAQLRIEVPPVGEAVGEIPNDD